MTYLVALNDIYKLIERSEDKASLPEVINKKVYELNLTLSDNVILYLEYLLFAQQVLEMPDLVKCTIRACTSSHTGHSYFNPVEWVGGAKNKLL